MAQWARLSAKHWRSNRDAVMGYGEPLGHPQLRQAIGSQTAQAYDAILVALRHREDLDQNKQFASDFVQKLY